MKKQRFRRVAGLVLITTGALILLAPIIVGEWVISLLGGVFVLAGGYLIYENYSSAEGRAGARNLAPGVISSLIGVTLFLSPQTALTGLLAVITLFLVADGGVKIYNAVTGSGSSRIWGLVNGLVSIVLGIAVWLAVSSSVGSAALGIVLGLWLAMQGWRLLMSPEKRDSESGEGLPGKGDLEAHPDRKLRVEPGKDLRSLNEELWRNDRAVARQDVFWSVTLLGILFATHYVRTRSAWSFYPAIAPVVATIGDVFLALMLGTLVVLPLRLTWRRITRPAERFAWNRLRELESRRESLAIGERLVKRWIEARVRFSHDIRTARESLYFAFWRLLRFGLPLTAVLVAVSAIWGFSWYYNSENWASIVFQRLTENRVDDWRQRAAVEVEKLAIANGVRPEEVFRIRPQSVPDGGDFSFIVIGDTGEGDASQTVLRDQIIGAGSREEVKFLLLSSDVIYPDGRMEDYEANFYLPFKGFTKPVFAIPGNHDWFDAGEAFMANFYEKEAALVSLREGVARDLLLDDSSVQERYTAMTAEADRLRRYYGIKNGGQRAPYFELHTKDFSLIAVDTGILRELDEKQQRWLEDALARAEGNFKFVVLGHPFYVAGKNTAPGDDKYASVLELLRRHEVDVVMAGDTHDFEYYREPSADDKSDHAIHHFINGGGGAYLSIGTALGFPRDPVTKDYAFYPGKEAVTSKIRRDSSFWGLPLLFWIESIGGWPFDEEIFSGAFDFNSSPFFQSFMVVNVEPSRSRVRMELIGDRGPLRWSDLQTGGSVRPAGTDTKDPVEFIIEMEGTDLP